MKIYLGGCEGIKRPVDMDGSEIKAGDKLTWDYGDDKREPWMEEPIFLVSEHRSGKGLCATGIHRELYLHDFRFKYCKKI